MSPTIRNYHFQDPTIIEFTINSTSKNTKESQTEDYFNEFLSLYKFEQHHIEEPQRKLFIQYFLQLGNIEESINLQPTSFEELEPENVIDKIKEIIDFLQKNQPKLNRKTTNSVELKLNRNINKVISYAASHFSEISKEQMKELTEEILEEILSNESEEEFLEFIIEKYEEDRN